MDNLRICRICLAEEGNSKFQRIFEKSPKVASDLFFVCGIQLVEIVDRIPALICPKCQQDLKISARLKRIAIVADRFFRKNTSELELQLWDIIDVPVKAETTELEQTKQHLLSPGNDNEGVMNTGSDDCDYAALDVNSVENYNSHGWDSKNDDNIDDDWSLKTDDDEFFNETPRKKQTPSQKRTPKSMTTTRVKNIYNCWCLETFTSKNALIKHSYATHTSVPEDKMTPCPLCDRKFKLEYYRDRHIKETHGENKRKKIAKNIPCSYCGRVMSSLSALQAHEGIHKMGDKPPSALDTKYQCDKCGRYFRLKPYVLKHIIKVHLKLRKYKCRYCPADFVHEALRIYHEHKHLNIRNHACKYGCGKTFVTSSCARIHERIHTDDRPYSCWFCDRTFIHHSDHRRHELKHTGGIPKKEYQKMIQNQANQQQD